VAAVRIEVFEGECHPVIVDFDLFPMIDCIEARDNRLKNAGGIWADGTPKVITNKARGKVKRGEKLLETDYELDTNFGKLKRIPYKPLQDFMIKHKAI